MLHLPIFPAFEQNNLAISMQTSDYFAPYASVTLLSIIENASPSYNYDFLVMSWDMKEETEQMLVSLADGRTNVSVRVIDISEEIKPYQKSAEKGMQFNKFGYAGLSRLLIPETLNNYDIVLNLDCDMLLCADVAELFQYDLSDYYVGAVVDMVSYTVSRLFSEEGKYIKDKILNKLQLGAIEEYLNGGVWLLNLIKIRKDFSEQQIIDYARMDGDFFRYYEQDAFNGLFAKSKLQLPMEWNWYVDSGSLIQQGAKYLAPSDQYLELYYGAEKRAKNYHYLTRRKPWDNAGLPYAKEWWKMAQKSPFLNVILSRTSKNSFDKNIAKIGFLKKQYLLFICETECQLFNALNIKYHYFKDTPADLILCSVVDLEKYVERLHETRLFRRIIRSLYNSARDWNVIADIPTRIKTLYPEKYEYAIKLEEQYTDYFLQFPKGAYNKMLYYQMVKTGVTPAVHIYEDGLATYSENIDAMLSKGVANELYPENKRLINNIDNIFLYKPEVYSGTSRAPKMAIPVILHDDEEFIGILHSIFGQWEPPKEKYIFLNEVFAAEGKMSNDVQILDEIADIVGKDNIVVKMHPRAKGSEKIYRTHGYKIYSSDAVLWEMYVLSAEMNEKVLISVSSNAMYIPYTVFDKKVRVISLINLMNLSRRSYAEEPAYRKVWERLEKKANEVSTIFYSPRSLMELENIIRYIEGEG